MNPQGSRSSVVPALIAAIIAAIITAVLTVHLMGPKPPGTSANTPATASVFDRVLKSGTIRCGYVIYPPGLIKNPNTKAIEGVFPETLAAASKALGLKVEWVEEVGWGSMIEGLEADRYDMICSPVWANASRAKRADFTVPLFYSGIGIYTRTDDHRFDADQAALNSSSVKLATIDGEMSDIISHQDFPEASRVSLPQLSDNSQLLLGLKDKKADATFVEPYIAQQFLASNPGTIRNIALEKPIRIFPNTMMVKKGETKLRTMMDTALLEVLNSGVVDKILRRYSKEPGTFYPVALPYRADVR